MRPSGGAGGGSTQEISKLKFEISKQCDGLAGRRIFLFPDSWACAALQPRLSHYGPLALRIKQRRRCRTEVGPDMDGHGRTRRVKKGDFKAQI